MKRNMIDDAPRKHGIVRVPSTFPDSRGRNVNKLRREYTFLVGRDTMKLLHVLDKLPPDKEGWLLKLSPRQMGRVVDEAAQAIGIQKKPPTRIGESWSAVHPNTFRKYWKKCMLDAKADTRAVLHLMGSNVPSVLRGWEPTDEELLEAYEKGESKLSLVKAPETEAI